MAGLLILDRDEFTDEQSYQEAVAQYIHPTNDEEKKNKKMITADDMPV